MLEKKQKIELLAPAKNLLCGKEAILHGADAVYMGAPKFGARAAAGNTLEEIAEMCQFAHQFGAKVHVALNTILTDFELKEAQSLIWNLFEAGMDALIIQDFGILILDLPPVALHASTQCNNRTVEHINMLEQLGFQRVILARELSLNEIIEIRKHTKIELECFVHGSLCVSYSGNCYASQACMKRSANSGNCAQMCRLPYQLFDKNNNELHQKSHFLSIKDMNRSEYLEEMLDVGITSFKIEGRLKEVNYVKNITAFYNQKLTHILEKRNDFARASFGKSIINFTPNPEKSFHRGSTDYFLKNNNDDVSQWITPKSMGEFVGTVKQSHFNYFVLEGKQLNNGDGIVFVNENQEFDGCNVNAAEGNQVFLAEKKQLEIGQEIYRNYDHQFENQLKKQTAQRKIGAKGKFSETENGFLLELTDERGVSVSEHLVIEKVVADKKEETRKRIVTELQKTGNTIFQFTDFQYLINEVYFIPASLLSSLRRNAFEKLDQERIRTQMTHINRVSSVLSCVQNKKQTTYLQNINNQKSAEIYQNLGFSIIEYAFEKEVPKREVPVMFCKFCIKKALGFCQKDKFCKKETLSEPLYLKSNRIEFRLEFDCEKCEMQLFLK